MRSSKVIPLVIAVILVVLFPGAARNIASAIGGQAGLPQVSAPEVSISVPALPAVPSVDVPSTVPVPRSADNAGFQAAGLAALGSVPTLDSRPFRAGYDRECGKDKDGKVRLCVFGPAWTDDTVAPGGHNGCDTRNDLLKATLTDITFKGTSKCVVQSGHLAHEPYTGKSVDFLRGGSISQQLDVDHVVPLKVIWDYNGADWTLEKRTAVANDPMNLILASPSQNRQKGDKTPSEWMPASKDFACEYASKYAGVAAAYGLPMSVADKDSLTLALTNAC